jgi:hypothetical protein
MKTFYYQRATEGTSRNRKFEEFRTMASDANHKAPFVQRGSLLRPAPKPAGTRSQVPITPLQKRAKRGSAMAVFRLLFGR